MASTKKITMREFNGTDYDTLYPKTIASQIPDVYSKAEIDATKASMEIVTYVGTGSTTLSINFPHTPKVVILGQLFPRADTTNGYQATIIWGETNSMFIYSSGYVNFPITYTSNRLTMSQKSGGYPFNESGVTYKIVSFY